METLHTQGILHYRGYGNCACHCLYDVYINGNGITIIFTESPDNTGTSVTNMAETIISMLFKKLLGSVIPGNTNPCDIFWIEHYPSAVLRDEETYDRVEIDFEGGVVIRPRWSRLSYFDVLKRITNG